ncbi:MAG: Hsp20/alpha crystallin family protein [Acidobacteria bacterium]|nr:Hsp20/alpha crystallin family protein [Acidobacteriota bacterium]
MTHLTLFNPSFRRLFADPFFDLPVRYADGPSGRTNGAALRTPPVDVRESDTEVIVEAELPGIPRDSISVRYHDGRLVLEGQRQEVHETGDGSNGSGSWVRRERVLGRFRRSFELPESVDSSAIKAESRDGVLRVVLPKLEKAQPRQIEVSVH